MLRAYFDLMGLPPTPEEVEQFLADESADAYEKLIDRLLASPHYGERWARHWLDVAGYADSEGLHDARRRARPGPTSIAITSFARSTPTSRSIASSSSNWPATSWPDRCEGDLTPEQIELLTATGFLRMAADGTASGDDSPEARNQVVADTIKIVTHVRCWG